MPTSTMISRVMGTTMIAATMACSDMTVAELQKHDLSGPEEVASQEPGNEELGRQEQGVWPDNEPAGMTPIIAVDGSSKEWSGFAQGGAWIADDRIRVVADPASKYGRAIEKRYFIGDKSGWHANAWRGNYGAFREIYQRIVFRVSSNWQWHSGGSKFFYWGGSGRPPGRSPTQFFVNSTAGGQIQFIDQSTSGERDSKGTFRANAAPITRGRYHTIEILHTANTPGRSDGALRMWINGVEVEGFNHLGRRDRMNVRLENIRWLDYSDTRLTGIEAFMFWGGQGDTKRVNDWIRLSELYVSGKNVNSDVGVGVGNEPRGQDLTGNWSFSATGGNSGSGITCDIEGTADLSQGGTKFDGSMAGTTACSWPGRSAEWEFDDTVVGTMVGDDVVFNIIGSEGHANGTATRNSMSGTVTWRINTGGPMGLVVLSGNWSGVRQ